ncbi:MAG TPA: hypothetical protein VNC62_18980 [Burkholderiales bacterium]|nr:hypothetical protein [Burkholderiales bacterium]
MIPPDKEIFEVESRIAARRAQLKSTSREAGRRTMQKLTSPVALIGAVALGFFVAGGLAKREKKPEHPERRKSDHMKAAKATGIVGTLVTGAMWVIRAQYGSPTRFAQAMLQKFQSKKAQVSPRRDMARP